MIRFLCFKTYFLLFLRPRFARALPFGSGVVPGFASDCLPRRASILARLLDFYFIVCY